MRLRAFGGRVAIFAVAVGVVASSVAFGQEVSSQEQSAVRTGAEPANASAALARAVEAEQARQQRRQRPDEQQARLLSRTSFVGQTAAEALALAQLRFPAALRNPVWKAPGLRSGDQLIRYGSDHAAIIKTGGTPGGSVLQSTVPLVAPDANGDKRPVDLELEAHGDEFRPRVGVAKLIVPSRLRDGIELADVGVKVRLLGSDLDGSPTLTDGRLFWPNVDRDTDLVVVPIPQGFETYHQLRSSSSPERLGVDFELPAEATMSAGTDGALRITKGQDVLAWVTPPLAMDADDEPIPTAWTVDGTRAWIEVSHRDRDLKYPLVVDPGYIEENYLNWEGTAMDFTGWESAESDPGSIGINYGTGWGLNTWFSHLYSYPFQLWGMWRFHAPGDTFISNGLFNNTDYQRLGGGTCLKQGFFKQGFPGRNDDGNWDAGWQGPPGSVNGTQPWIACSEFYDVDRAHDIDFANPTRGNYFASMQQWRFGSSMGSDDNIHLAGAWVRIHDDRGPVALNASGIPTNWTNSPPGVVYIEAFDNGLGMSHIDLTREDNVVQGQQDLSCVTQRNSGWQCPYHQWLNVPVSFPEGITGYSLYARDYVDNDWEQWWDAKVDRWTPKLELAGPGFDLKDETLGDSSNEIYVDSWDDEPSTTWDVSGVRSAELFVTDAQGQWQSHDLKTNLDCTGDANCAFQPTLTLRPYDVNEGSRRAYVTVTDGAGNRKQSAEWNFSSVSGLVLSPRSGLRASRRVTLEGESKRAGHLTLSWDYRRPDSDPTNQEPWISIPTGALSTTQGGSLANGSLSLTSGKSTPVVWDMGATPNFGADGPVEVRGVFSGGAGGTTAISRFEFDGAGLDPRTARDEIGPGEVNLLTGNFTMSDQDAAIESPLTDLTLTRSYNSRAASANASGMFGPGWTATVSSLDLDATWARLIQRSGVTTIAAVDNDGSEVAFKLNGSGYRAQAGFDDLTLKRITSRTGSTWTYELTDLAGTVATFERSSSDPNVYVPTTIKTAGDSAAAAARQSKFIYETPSGGVTRLKTVFAPAPIGYDCQSNFSSACRAMEFVYAQTTTATGTAPGQWGDYTNRLVRVDFKAYEPSSGSITTTTVVRYEYDTAGKLRGVYDPRISPTLKDTYAYDGNGILFQITPPGEEPWTLTYQSATGDSTPGRLRQVSRSALDDGTARWTVVYAIPLAGGSSLENMSPGSSGVERWGQTDIPTDATAIFPPDQVPSSPPSSYERAEVHYLNRYGDEVNLASPGGRISTSERDQYGNVVRELTAANRARVLGPNGPSATDVDTTRVYQADGLEMTEEIGPKHQVRIPSAPGPVSAELKKVVAYDEGAPQGTDPHLPTTTTVGAIYNGALVDTRVTKTEYDWTLRQPTKTIVDPGGLALETRRIWDSATGLELETRMPSRPAGSDASTIQRVYYSAGANSSDSACGNKPQWHNLLCKQGPAAQPGTTGLPSLATTTHTYNRLGQSTTITDQSGSTTRTTTTSYDTAGRIQDEGVSSTAGTVLSNVQTTYDSATGRVTRLDSDGRSIIHSYDTLGRLTSYTDADNVTSTTDYDLLDRPAVTNDGKGSQVRTYDPVTSDLTRLDDSAAGVFTATYDADGEIDSKQLPGGLAATYRYDASGAPIGLTYTRTTGCSSNCTWLNFDIVESIHGQWRSQSGTLADRTYDYDAAGRLTRATDTPAGGSCTARQYGYDANSNRTSKTTLAGTSTCPTTGGTQQSYTYDAANRLTQSGIAYDAFGRITTLPTAVAGGGALTTSYYTNDLVRQQSQDGVTNMYDLDPAYRVRRRTTTRSGWATVDEISHYDGSSDEPTWARNQNTGRWERYIEGIDGDLAAIDSSDAGAVLQLADLHGDIVATQAVDPLSSEPVQQLTATASSSGAWTVQGTRPLDPGLYVAQVEQTDSAGNLGKSSLQSVEFSGTPRTYRQLVAEDDAAILYWPLDDSGGSTADLGTADGAADVSTRLGGVATGQPTPLVDTGGFSNGFDGVDDRVRVNDITKFNFGSASFTAEAWIRTAQNGNRAIMSKGHPSDTTGWHLVVSSDSGHVGQLRGQIKTLLGTATVYSAGRVDDNVWHHVALVVDRTSQLRVYVDGAQAGSTGSLPGGSVDATTNFLAGWVPAPVIGSQGPAFQGQIDEVALYGSALSGTRVKAHYDAELMADRTAPTLNLGAPANGSTTNDNTPVASGVGGTAKGDATATTVSLYSGDAPTGSPVQTLTAPRASNGQYSVESWRAIPDGQYTARAEQTDLAGNRTRSNTPVFTVSGAADPGDYRTAVRADGPLAYWRLAEAPGATIAADDMGSYPAAITTGVGLGVTGALPGDPNTAATMTTGNGIAVTDGTKLDPGLSDFTAEVWVKANPISSQVTPIIAKGTTALSSAWTLKMLTTGQAQATVKTALASPIVTTTGSIGDEKWHSIVLVKRNSGLELYVDGVLNATTSATIAGPVTNTAPLMIGDNTDATSPLQGRIDEVAYYAKALTASQIATHYRRAYLRDNEAPAPTITSGASTASAPIISGIASNSNADSDWVNVRIYRKGTVTSTYRHDEFGVPLTAGDDRAFAWLGAKQRRTDLRSGVIKMGVRSYVPSLGRFLQVDPVEGGSANAYDYANQDPVNQFDLDGRRPDAKGPRPGCIWVGHGFMCAGPRSRCGTACRIIKTVVLNAPWPGAMAAKGARAVRHIVRHATKKRAKDAARKAGDGAPIHHPRPKVGRPHYHPTRKGKKKRDGVHHEYPRR